MEFTDTNTNNSTVNQNQTVTAPPPSAIAPTVNAGGLDTCTTAVSGSVQTQIVGIAGGSHIRDLNCERLKKSKTLYNMGMKVAAIALLCQDVEIFLAMDMAGTPCPFDGEIGEAAQKKWKQVDPKPKAKPVHPKNAAIEQQEEIKNDTILKTLGGLSLLLLLL